MKSERKYQQFIQELKENLPQYLPENFPEKNISFGNYIKNNNKISNSIIISNLNDRNSPSIDLDSYFYDYKNNVNIGVIANDIVQTRTNFSKDSLTISNYLTTDKIFFKVSEMANNFKRLLSSPYTIKNDMVLSYHLFVDNNDLFKSIPLNNNIMEHMGLSLKEVHNLALKNTPKLFPAEFISITDAILKKLPEIGRSKFDINKFDLSNLGTPSIYVLSNDIGIFGAGALFYPGQLDSIYKQLGKDFIILPSSIHETIITPYEKQNHNDLIEMVKQLNMSDVVEPEDVLTNDVYVYDGVNKEMVPVGEYKVDFINVKMDSNTYNLFEKMMHQENSKDVHYEIQSGYEI